jgi:hypothetical protein
MKIAYDENPLKIQVFLDDEEKDLLRSRIIDEALKDAMWSIYLDKENNLNNIEKETTNIIEELTESGLIQERFDYLLKALEKGEHAGDCTCQPFSCSKCEAEYLLGIDTIKDLPKSMAYSIDRSFRECESLDGAIIFLNKTIPSEPSEEYKQYPELWSKNLDSFQKTREQAAKWLVNYRNEHFGVEHE